jgi:hypothetical protein
MSTEYSAAERQNRFRFIYNSLALFAMSYEDLMKLDAPMFDVEFELESEFEIAFIDMNIDCLYDTQFISQSTKQELLDFKAFIETIPGPLWRVEEFETNEVWNTVRRKANLMLNLLQVSDRDYDLSRVKIV